jgi:hypothetical protein
MRFLFLALALLLAAGCSSHAPPGLVVDKGVTVGRVVDVDPATFTERVRLPLIPRPKSATFTRHGWSLPDNARIVLPSDAGPLVRQGADELRDWLDRHARIHLVTASSGPIVLKVSDDQSLPPEGYALATGTAGVRIEARDERGFYHAIQTLEQLIEGRRVRGATIRDWPTLGFRGVHWHSGHQALALHRRLSSRTRCAFTTGWPPDK